MKYVDPSEIREAIQEFVSKIGADPIARRVTFQWGNRSMVRTIAYATWPDCEITFSPIIWPLLSDEERLETIAHEVSHLGDFLFQFNLSDDHVRSHGRSWKAMMARAGYPDAQACTILAPHVVRAAMSQSPAHIPVSCSCMTHFITRYRAMKLVNGEGRMRCKHCRSNIEISSFVDGDAIIFGKGGTK